MLIWLSEEGVRERGGEGGGVGNLRSKKINEAV